MANFISQFISQVNNEFNKIFTPESSASTSEATNGQAALPSKAYSIAHAVPGRVRLYIPSISQNPSYVERLKALLEAEEWVTSERTNPKAGSIVITYKHRTISDSEMRSRLANLIESAVTEPKSVAESTLPASSVNEPATEPKSVAESTLPASSVNENFQQAEPCVEVAEETPKVTDAPEISPQPVPEEVVDSSPPTQSSPQKAILTEELSAQQDVISSKLEPSNVLEPDTVLDNRVFLFEVVGLHQSKEADVNDWSIRNSGSVFIRVPYNRMNQQMRQINRLGGKIVSIRSA